MTANSSKLISSIELIFLKGIPIWLRIVIQPGEGFVIPTDNFRAAPFL